MFKFSMASQRQGSLSSYVSLRRLAGVAVFQPRPQVTLGLAISSIHTSVHSFITLPKDFQPYASWTSTCAAMPSNVELNYKKELW